VAALTRSAPRPLTAIAAILVAALVAGCGFPVLARGPRTAASPAPSPATSSVGSTGPTATATPRPTPIARGVPTTSLTQLVGQKLIVAMDAGATPSAALLGRIRRGEVGGVILFGRNVTTAGALRALTTKLRDGAQAGGQPQLLIAVDQEGGSIKRIPWAPPTLSPPQMAADGRASTARSQGAATGLALRGLGINVDLAPVADVPSSTSSFLYKQRRTFSFNAAVTTSLADAFAAGLQSEGVIAAMKHFPGLGRATLNTDTNVVTIRAGAATLAPGLRPYEGAIGHGLRLVMLSNATYSAYDPDNAAGWSRTVSNGLLRTVLGFRGVTITDSLDGTAHARGVSTASLALRAARAGTDLILVTGSEAESGAVFTALYDAARAGTVARTTLLASYARIRDLKAGL
jgi:beta-N-acetylhexosaminidase